MNFYLILLRFRINYEYVLILEVILAVVILFVFFLTASNISKIRKMLCSDFSPKEYISMAEQEKYIGNIDKAKEYLMRARFKLEKFTETTVDGSESQRQLLKEVNEELNHLK